MDTFVFRGTPVVYERRGSGPGILFLHNGGTSRAIWRPQMMTLSADFDVTAVDLPGFGDSPLAERRLTLADYTEMVGALVEHLGTAPVVIVGNCMGSNIATGVVEERPELVRALVLVNPLTESTFDAGWLGWLHRMERYAPRTTRVFRRVSRRVRVPGFVAPLVLRFQLGPAGIRRRVHHDPELIACNRRPEQLPALIDVLDDMAAYGELDRGRDLGEVPVLTVWGGRNHVLSPRRGDSLDEGLEPMTRITLDDSGHLPMLEEPDALTAAIKEFLTTIGHASGVGSKEVS